MEASKAILDEYDRTSNLAPEQRGYDKSELMTSDTDIENIKLDIRVYPLDDPQGSTKAFASVSVDDLIAIRGLRVIEGGEDGLFVAMPQSQGKDRKYHDVAFPLTKELRDEINKGVLEKYKTPERAVDRKPDRKPSLGDKLDEGNEKAAGHIAPAKSAAKSHVGAIE